MADNDKAPQNQQRPPRGRQNDRAQAPREEKEFEESLSTSTVLPVW